MSVAMTALDTEQDALRRDSGDPLPARRDAFEIPPWPGGAYPEWAYFAGNSLGLLPRSARPALAAELTAWSTLAVESWFEGDDPWLEASASTRGPLARLVGAEAHEVATMNSLTVNLHLLLASFYRPDGDRYRIVVEDSAFPSDSHAVQSQAALHGHDPADAVVRAPVDDLLATIDREGDRLALVLLGAVNYLTGERLDVPVLTAAAHAVGAVSGWDLAHAIGNVPVALHDAGSDFAVWCHYKYVNAGPGAPGGLFVHDRHGTDPSRPRLAGWWGVDRAERFRMEPDFVPAAGADGWAVSTPPILSLAPLRASLALFDDVGLPALRERSMRLTAYLEMLLDDVASRRQIGLPTPRDPERRGCQLSVSTHDARALATRLRERHGVVCDFREPDVLRFAPVPLSNTFHDCWRAAVALDDVLGNA